MDLSLYTKQQQIWPPSGKHILAQYDDQSVIVYQAYKPSIGQFAAQHGYFGGDFKLGRMTWVKPNFLWMMYRCGWGKKADQETILAIHLKRTAFDHILDLAVHSSFQTHLYQDHQHWKHCVAESDVRLQWDPDHDPEGQKLSRRAIQLGMRGDAAIAYSRDWLLGVEDITEFVHQQAAYAHQEQWHKLITPTERIYRPAAPDVCAKLELAD